MALAPALHSEEIVTFTGLEILWNDISHLVKQDCLSVFNSAVK